MKRDDSVVKLVMLLDNCHVKNAVALLDTFADVMSEHAFNKKLTDQLEQYL